METLPEGHREKSRTGRPYFGPFPHHGQHEQGHRQGSCPRSKGIESQRTGTGSKRQPVVIPQACGKHDLQADREPGLGPQIQPQDGEMLSDERGISVILGIQVTLLCRQIPGIVVRPNDALQDRTNEGCGQDAPKTSGADSELVPSEKSVFI